MNNALITGLTVAGITLLALWIYNHEARTLPEAKTVNNYNYPPPIDPRTNATGQTGQTWYNNLIDTTPEILDIIAGM